jgi:hypothetical protein
MADTASAFSTKCPALKIHRTARWQFQNIKRLSHVPASTCEKIRQAIGKTAQLSGVSIFSSAKREPSLRANKVFTVTAIHASAGHK